MELEQALQAIDTLIKNKEYNKIIHKYIDDIISGEFIYFEDDGEIIISDAKYEQYFTLVVKGPEYIELDFLYHNKKENYKHVLVFTMCENEIVVISEIYDNENIYSRHEEYKDNELKYAMYKDYDNVNEIDEEKEIIFNSEGLNYISIQKSEIGKKPFSLCTVNKVNKPYIFDTSEENNEYDVTIIHEISEKQYHKAKKGAISSLMKNPKQEKRLARLLKRKIN